MDRSSSVDTVGPSERVRFARPRVTAQSLAVLLADEVVGMDFPQKGPSYLCPHYRRARKSPPVETLVDAVFRVIPEGSS